MSDENKIITREGEGDPVGTGLVTVDYVGKFTNGEEFDASKNHGTDGFTFNAGNGQVIECWDTYVPTMKVGEKATLKCPANMAYGASGAGKIPPDSDLVFEVEVLKKH